jgi:hypothetical protein
VAILFQILVLNGGRLVYTLDDAYIHLAVAENIARGTYGVNLGESSAPSSSILYPFLLAPFGRLGGLELAPLAIGLVASLATVRVWSRIVASALALPDLPRGRAFAPMLVTFLIVGTNLVGVLFTGMEHSLQLFATALLIWGLVVERETGRGRWWLWLAVVLGPLVRYENLALSLPALAYLFLRGHRRASLATLAVLTLSVGAFSAFLLASGHGILPTSVLIKTGAIGGDGGFEGLVGGIVGRLFLRQGALLALMLALLVTVAIGQGDRDDRQLAAWCAAGVLAHLVMGPFGSLERYELYVWSAALLTGLLVFRVPLRRLVAATPPLPLLVGASGVTLALAFPYVHATLKTPLGSNNIFEQHVQMHRFVTEFYDGPVAVIDLGRVSFRNDRYVLDLWGLGLRRAAEARIRGDESYMVELVREYDVDLAMLYGAWYPDPPAGWTAVGDMRLGKARLTPAEDRVTFYALSAEAEPRIRSLLEDFRATLPRGVELVLRP